MDSKTSRAPIPNPNGVSLFIRKIINTIPPMTSVPQAIKVEVKLKLLNHFCINKSTHHPINKKPHECGDNSTMNISHL